jgi:hypothetical protein
MFLMIFQAIDDDNNQQNRSTVPLSAYSEVEFKSSLLCIPPVQKNS